MSTPRGILQSLRSSDPSYTPNNLNEALLQPNTSTSTASIWEAMPQLDLNAQHQPPGPRTALPSTQVRPLNQRYALLEDQHDEALSDISVADLTPEEQEHIAHHVLRDLTDNLKPLSGAEYLIVIPAILFALGACATSKDFGDKFVQGLESLLTSFKASPDVTKTGIAWGVAAANVCAQFSLSTNSVITVLTRLLHSRQRISDAKSDPKLAAANETANKYDKPLTWKEKAFLAAVPLSAAATYKMGMDTLTGKYELSPAIGHSVGSLRYGSASLINFNFTYDQIHRWRGDNENLPLINLLKTSKKRLNTLANDARNPLDFIRALQQNNLLKQLNGKNTNPVENDTHKKQVEALVDELFQSTPFQQAQASGEVSSRCTKADVVQWFCMILGGLVSFTNFKAGTRVPELFELAVAKDLVAFFSNLSADWTLAVAALGLVFGIPSWFVNLIINARSCMNLANGISSFVSDIQTNGIDALKKYWSTDGALVATLFVTSLGYGAGNGGSGFKYPPLDMVPIPIINLLLSSVVFTALGNLSQQGAVAKLRDKLDDDFLQDAIKSHDLEDFYQSLSPAQQNTLRRLLINNINLAFDSQISSYNKLQDHAVNGMLSEELQKNLENRYGTDLTSIRVETPTTPATSAHNAADMTGVVIDPMLTIAQKSQLTDILIDPMAPKKPTLPLRHQPNHGGGGNQTNQLVINGSPSFTGSVVSSPTFFSGSPSTGSHITRQPGRRHHSSHTSQHHSILGDSENSLYGIGGTILTTPTQSPSIISVSPNHTPRLHPITPTRQTDAITSTTTATHPTPRSSNTL